MISSSSPNSKQKMTPIGRHIIVLILFLISLITICASHESDSITINQSLSGDQKITSKDGNFVLGFFTKDNSSSRRFYIGIWYKRVSDLTPVWVANRATPVSNPTKALLHISHNGNLVLRDQLAKSLIWSTNATISSQYSTVAVLQDSGNLVLKDGENSSNVFWQSFENPTDTWLPGAKVAFNKRTGVKNQRRFTSCKNSGNPAPGLFSYEMGTNGQLLIKWNMSKTYWTSGPWDGRSFSQIPQMIEHHMSEFTYVNNSEEIYFSYTANDNATIFRVIMDFSGQLKTLMWLEAVRGWTQVALFPEAQCQVTALCGPFGSCNEQRLQHCSCVVGFSERSPKDWALSDHSGGCVRNTPLRCDGSSSGYSEEQDEFFQMTSVRLPDDGQALQVDSVKACELACLNNCSCTAYSYGSTGCSLWYGDLLNLQDHYDGSDGGTLYLRLAASDELPSHHHKNGMVYSGVAGVIALSLACLVVVSITLVITIWLRKRIKASDVQVTGGLTVFRYSDLQRVTKNFSDKLGAGSFGSVFKGVLSDSTAIAVKKLQGIRQGEKQFRAEVSILGTIQHVNFVSLRGFCAEGTERLLVFDYMPNGSLDSHLFHSNAKVLDWSTRYQIALGIARGLAYLHEKCRECIIHCDIKPENILLDVAFNPKVADFGLAKLFGREFSHVLTSMRGTFGYLAPEWISGLAITTKADVFSYGMMFLEIISGKRNAKQSESGVYYFPVKAAIKVREGMVDCLLDGRLHGNANMDELNIACRVACWCIQDLENERPTMGMVVQMLEGILEVGIPPVSSILQGLIVDSDTENLILSDILDDAVKQSIFTS